MSDEATCGKGLAAHASLPARMSALTAAMAAVLENHLGSVSPWEPEHEAYTTLVADYRTLTTALEQIADRMAGYRDLPMAAHDEAVLSSAAAAATFEAYVQSERDLLTLLQSWVTRDEAMLRGEG